MTPSTGDPQGDNWGAVSSGTHSGLSVSRGGSMWRALLSSSLRLFLLQEGEGSDVKLLFFYFHLFPLLDLKGAPARSPPQELG